MNSASNIRHSSVAITHLLISLYIIFVGVILAKIDRVVYIICEFHGHHLACIIYRICTQEWQKPSWGVHRTYWANECISAAWTVQIACCFCIYHYVYFLHHYYHIWLLGIRHWEVPIFDIDERRLLWWAGVLTPKSFQIYCADVTAIPQRREYPIYLLIWLSLLLVCELVAATLLPIVLFA